ncbi:hypothetical protein O6H91_03G135300 [Diphasiastrum complanatum]|uniref:Uncharacterized protein n=1 Tax=Diphasiastrum complanatum TaxID=34168 RepID=A0ACC2ECE1_DIPCM|nr:hypothetical protein O6H91_03G135300 [Diphasiastrum complanatum]
MILQGREKLSLRGQEDFLRELDVNSEVSQLEHAESETSLSGSVQTAETPPQTEGIWTCHDCGWTFPNSRPSAKHRRNHRKNCGKFKNVDIDNFNGPLPVAGSSDEEEHQKTEHGNGRHHNLQGPKEEQIDSLADRISNSLISIELGNPLENDFQNVKVTQNGVPNRAEDDMSANELHCNLDPQNQCSILESPSPETSQLMTDEAHVERTAAIIPEESVTIQPIDSEKVKFLIQEVQDSSPIALIATESIQCMAPKEENHLGLSAELQHKTIVLSEGSTSLQNFDAQTFPLVNQSSKSSFRENEQTHLNEEIPVKGSSEGSQVDATQNIAPAILWSAYTCTSNEVLAIPACEHANVSDFGKEPSSVHLPVYEKHISSINGGDPVSVSEISGRLCTGHQSNSTTSVAGRNHESFKELQVVGSKDSSKAQGVEVPDLDIVLSNSLTGRDNSLAVLVANAEKELLLPQENKTTEKAAKMTIQEWNDSHAEIVDEKAMQDGHSQKQLEGFRDHVIVDVAKTAEVKDQHDGFCGESDCTSLDAAQQIEPITVSTGAAGQTYASQYVSIGLIVEPLPHGDEEAEAVEPLITESYSGQNVNVDHHQVSQPLSLVKVCIPSLCTPTSFTGDAPIQEDPTLKNSINHTHFVPITEDGTRGEGSSSFPLSPTMGKEVFGAQLLQLNPADSMSEFSGMESSILGEENTRSTINEADMTYDSMVHLIGLHSLDPIVDPRAFGYESPRVEMSGDILLMNDNLEAVEGARNSFQQGRTPELWEQLLDAELEKKDLSSLQQNISDHLLLLPANLQPESAENLGLPGEPNLHPEQMGSLYMQENLFGAPPLQPTSLESISVDASVEHGIPDKVISSIQPSLQHFQAPSFQTLVSDEYRLVEQQQSGQAQLRERMDNGNSTSSNLFTLDWEVFDSSQDQSNNSADSCVRSQKAKFYPFASSSTLYDALEYRKSGKDDYQGISKTHTPLKLLLAEDSGPKAPTETKDNIPSVKDLVPSPRSNPLIRRVLDKVMSSPASFGGVKPSRDKPKVNSKWSACICWPTMN